MKYTTTSKGHRRGDIVTADLQFKNVLAEMDDCSSLSNDDPVIAEVTPRGDLIIHNWDRKTDMVFLGFGMPLEDLPCFTLKETWERVVGRDQRQFACDLPPELTREAARFLLEFKSRVSKNVSKANYTPPYLREYIIDRAEISTYQLIGLHPSEGEDIDGKIVVIPDDYASQTRRYQVILNIDLRITVQGYMDVLTFIEDGLVHDEYGRLLFVIGIEEVIDDGRLLVRMGRPDKHQHISTEMALIEQSDPEGDWTLVKYLNW